MAAIPIEAVIEIAWNVVLHGESIEQFRAAIRTPSLCLYQHKKENVKKRERVDYGCTPLCPGFEACWKHETSYCDTAFGLPPFPFGFGVWPA